MFISYLEIYNNDGGCLDPCKRCYRKCSFCHPLKVGAGNINIGSLIIRIGFGGPLHYNYDKEPPQKHKIVLVIMKAPIVDRKGLLLGLGIWNGTTTLGRGGVDRFWLPCYYQHPLQHRFV